MNPEREAPTIPGDQMPESISRELQQEINRLVGRRGGSAFPGSQPVSFTWEHIEMNLKRRDYFVCEKSDGLRCLMLCILDPEGNEAVFMITRSNEYFRVANFHFPLSGDDQNTCHNGTLIDGELVISKRPDGVKELRYLMFDCLSINGLNLTAKPLMKRLGYLDAEFYKPYFKLRQQHPQECEVFPFKLSLKGMHMPHSMPKLFDNLKYLGHVTDGLIFTCCETPYIFGTDQTLLKWKPSEENTVDFKLHLEIPQYVDEDLDERDPDRQYPNYDVQPKCELHVWQGSSSSASKRQGVGKNSDYTYFADLYVEEDEWLKLKGLNEPLEQRIVECNKDESEHWRLLRFRDDKLDGNHVSVVKKVLQSIKDAVTKEQLIELAPEIEQMRKQREFERKRRNDPNYIPPVTSVVSSSSSNNKRSSNDADEMPTYEGESDSDDDVEDSDRDSDKQSDKDEDGDKDDDGKVTKKQRIE